MLGLALAWAGPPTPYTLHTVKGQPGFEVQDLSGKRVSAWRFAHQTGDRETVSALRPVVYGRRLAVIGTAVGGGLALVGGTGFIYAASRPRETRTELEVRPDITAAGFVATGGLMLVVSSVAIARFKPGKLRVDTHYSQEEALQRIQLNGIVLTPEMLGIDGTY